VGGLHPCFTQLDFVQELRRSECDTVSSDGRDSCVGRTCCEHELGWIPGKELRK
jgi:hypothetical protein